MNTLTKTAIIGLTCIALSGCLAAAAGAGAASAVYVKDNYDISVKKKHSSVKPTATPSQNKQQNWA